MSRHRELVEDALAALRAQGIAATVVHNKHVKVRFVNAQDSAACSLSHTRRATTAP
jgi:hypothetical protein